MTEVSQQVRGEWKPHLVRIVDRELAIFVSEGDEAPLKKVLSHTLSFHLCFFSLLLSLSQRGARRRSKKCCRSTSIPYTQTLNPNLSPQP